MPTNIVTQLKNHAFDLFLAITAPDAQEAPCSCIDQGASPCPNCAAYERLVEQFNAIPVG